MQNLKTKNLVLVVEDDPDISELIKLVLENNKFKVEICDDGFLVEKRIKKHSPFLILMDLWIPGINGVKLTKKIKANKQTKDIPIIITSAQNSLDKVVAKTKAEGFLAKPFDINNLVALVKKYSKS